MEIKTSIARARHTKKPETICQSARQKIGEHLSELDTSRRWNIRLVFLGKYVKNLGTQKTAPYLKILIFGRRAVFENPSQLVW